MRVVSHQVITLTPERMARRVYRERTEWPRTKGVTHAQAVNAYLAVAAGMMQPQSGMDAFSPVNYPLLPAMGVAWEDFWASLFDEDTLIWQPGEWERDGICGTPDGLFLDRPTVVLAECKLTYKKHKPVNQDWKYVRQGMAYCAMSSGIRQVEYHVCWALGEYQRPFKPIYDVTLVEFTEDEIELWWARMLAVKDKVPTE